MDEKDKTLFKQPGAGDSTVLKPTPGRKGGMDMRPPPVTPSYTPEPIAAAGAAPQGRVDLSAFGPGLNPIVQAASTLLMVFDKTRGTLRHANVAGLHNSLVNEIKQFENRLRDLNLKPEQAWASRYLMCTALDEAVMYTPWGGESAWGQRTLLSIFHRDTGGGEKSFQMLDQLRQNPGDNRAVLELFYLVLSLGFEGKYRLMPRGSEALEALRDDLYASIRAQRGDYERSLASAWQGLGRTRRTLSHYLPTWVAASVVAALVFFGYVGFKLWLNASSEPTLESLSRVAPISAPAAGSSATIPEQKP
ncbi:MAG TPA: type IVB secretion system protein IcmH/DotU [Cellvibrionaceae bacterium]|nr:type IVB secretion system protein IcmH/DotU [Cellvibrionaceae bacterium]HNG60627.1 type IVB secretion system protein IcmH/DotU [Cellvibrionaceae bacterium]